MIILPGMYHPVDGALCVAVMWFLDCSFLCNLGIVTSITDIFSWDFDQNQGITGLENLFRVGTMALCLGFIRAWL